MQQSASSATETWESKQHENTAQTDAGSASMSADEPDGTQMLQISSTAVLSVFLPQSSVQARLQQLHSAHKELTLLKGIHSQQFALLCTDAQS